MYWKNAAAQSLPFTLNPRLLYRGTGASIANEMQMMVLQFGLTRVFQRLLGHSSEEEYTPIELLGTSTMGGLTAALATSPIELIMIQQQLHGRSLPSTAFSIVAGFGAGSRGLYRGLGATMMRDGIYVGGLLGITPVMQSYLMNTHNLGSRQASFGASILGGIICSALSHPADILKTCLQGDLHQVKFKTSMQTLRTLWREGGARRFFKGGFARTLNITATIYIANESVLRLPPILFGTSSESNGGTSGGCNKTTTATGPALSSYF